MCNKKRLNMSCSFVNKYISVLFIVRNMQGVQNIMHKNELHQYLVKTMCSSYLYYGSRFLSQCCVITIYFFYISCLFACCCTIKYAKSYLFFFSKEILLAAYGEKYAKNKWLEKFIHVCILYIYLHFFSCMIDAIQGILS